MPEKNIEQQPQDESPKAQAGGKSHFMLIAVGATVFLAAVVVFSLQLGVFSSSNVKPTTETADMPTNAIDSTEQEADKEEEPADPYQALFDGYDGGEEDLPLSDTAVVRDSIAKSTWFAEQSQEIDRKRAELELEMTQLNQLRSQVEALLDRKKAMEEGNITQMAKLYEGMNTDELVPILANLSDAQVGVMISKMKKQKASEVLGKMAPERAAKITQYIISMND